MCKALKLNEVDSVVVSDLVQYLYNLFICKFNILMFNGTH